LPSAACTAVGDFLQIEARRADTIVPSYQQCPLTRRDAVLIDSGDTNQVPAVMP
jgi:hypothetical protein